MKAHFALLLLAALLPCIYAGPAICRAAVVVDSYITRNIAGGVNAARTKYTNYWADVNRFYQNNFGFSVELSYMFVEGATSSFTSTMNSGTLLDDFRAAVGAGSFSGIPTSGVCVYHLISGRQPSGVGGLAYVRTACSNYYNTGYAIDGQGNEGAELVIRRIIHELGHNFGGNHPDGYPSPPYTCSTNNNNAGNRILRDAHEVLDTQETNEIMDGPYTYLSQNAFISDCATNSIKSNLATFSCLRSSPDTSVFPAAIFFQNINYGGSSLSVRAYQGTGNCYNILPFNDQTSSFQLQSGSTGITGIRLYQDIDCLGSSAVFTGNTAFTSGFNDAATSFRFV